MSATPAKTERGQQAEEAAHRYLQQQGLKPLARNWRCKRGELDLVMLEGDTVVFVEVRYRQHQGWGGALESIDARKRSKLCLAAEHFLLEHPRWRSQPCRFDVIAWSNDLNGTPSWIKNAFDS